MGKMHLIKGCWYNKVGELVGAKWKDVNVLRSYTIPSNPNTESQQTVRTVFGDMTKFVSYFADAIKYYSALDTSRMSLRNAIMKLNKDQFSDGTFDPTTLLISSGGLAKLTDFATSFTASAGGTVTCTWTAPTASNITSAAQAIIVVVDSTEPNYDVIVADASEGTATGTVSFTAGDEVYIYGYILDNHSSYKIASKSTYLATA